MSGAELAQYARCRTPTDEHHHYVRQNGKPIRSTPRSCRSPSLPSSCSKQFAIEKRGDLAPEIASIPHAFSHTANSLRTAAAEFPTLSTAFRKRSPSRCSSAWSNNDLIIFAHIDFAAVRPTTPMRSSTMMRPPTGQCSQQRAVPTRQSTARLMFFQPDQYMSDCAAVTRQREAAQ